MSESKEPGYAAGDRIRAITRADFPKGTVLKPMENGFILVRWDSGMLETAHRSELERIE